MCRLDKSTFCYSWGFYRILCVGGFNYFIDRHDRFSELPLLGYRETVKTKIQVSEDRFKRLKQSAQRFTAYRERAPKEVADKIAEWGAKPEEIERLLRELKEENFIDEERFARAFCHDKFLINKWGKHRISKEIRKFELTTEVLEQGLAYIDQEEYEKTLAQLAQSKWSKVKDPDVSKKKQKTVNYLMQKGYESDLTWKVVNKLNPKYPLGYTSNGRH